MSRQQCMQHAEAKRRSDESWRACGPRAAQPIECLDCAGVKPALKVENSLHHVSSFNMVCRPILFGRTVRDEGPVGFRFEFLRREI